MNVTLPLWALLTVTGAAATAAVCAYLIGRAGKRSAAQAAYSDGRQRGYADRKALEAERIADDWSLVAHPDTGRPVWRDERAPLEYPPAAPAACACGQPDYPHTEHGPTLCTTFGPAYHAAPAAEPDPPQPELEPVYASVAAEHVIADAGGWISGPALTFSPAAGALIDRIMADEAEQGAPAADDVTYADLPGLASLAELAGPGGLAELDAQIDDYLADPTAHTDIWHLNIDREHRDFCTRNGLPWRPIDWQAP